MPNLTQAILNDPVLALIIFGVFIGGLWIAVSIICTNPEEHKPK